MSTGTKRMNTRERLLLDPMEKWWKHRRFPYKMLLHVILVTVFSVRMFMYSSAVVEHVAHTSRRFYRTFLGIDGDFQNRMLQLSTEQELRDFLERFQTAYHTKPPHRTDLLLSYPDLLKIRLTRTNGTVEKMFTRHRSKKVLWKVLEGHGFDIDELNQGNWLEASVFVLINDVGTRDGHCWRYDWHLHVTLLSQHGGQVAVRLKYDIYNSGAPEFSLVSTIVGMLSMTSLVLEFKKIVDVYKTHRRILTHPSERSIVPLLESSSPPPVSEFCLDFFDPWHIVAVVANLFQVASVLHACYVSHHDIYLQLNLLAFSTAFAWVNLVRYLAFFPMSYTLYRTLTVGIPKVAQFLVGVVPVFIAYSIVGVGLWGFDANWFSEVSMSACALFSLLNGDILHDSYMNLRDINWPLAQCYLYSFLCLFVYVVLNIFITIMEDAYFCRSESSNTRHWNLGSLSGAPTRHPSRNSDMAQKPCPLKVELIPDISPYAARPLSRSEILEEVRAMRAQAEALAATATRIESSLQTTGDED